MGADLLALAGISLLLYALWTALTPHTPLSFQPVVKPAAKTLDLGTTWQILTGWALTPRELQLLNAIVGLSSAVGILIVTHNPLVALAAAIIAWGIPEGVLKAIGQRRWRQLDEEALSACTSVWFALQEHRPVLPVWQHLYDAHDGLLHRVLAPCLAWEYEGLAPFEQTLKRLSHTIRHIELQLVADILATERLRGNTAPLLDTTLHLWHQRLEADARRRGQVAMTTLLSRYLLWAAIGLFALLWMTSPAIADHATHGVGLIVVGIAALIISGAAWFQRTAQRRVENV